MKLSETPQTYDGLRDLCIRGHFLNASPVDLSTYLRERKLPTLDEVAQSADLFLTARKRTVKWSSNAKSLKPFHQHQQAVGHTGVYRCLLGEGQVEKVCFETSSEGGNRGG